MLVENECSALGSMVERDDESVGLQLICDVDQGIFLVVGNEEARYADLRLICYEFMKPTMPHGGKLLVCVDGDLRSVHFN